MAVRIEPFSVADVGAVRAFNERLAAADQEIRFPEDPRPVWLPREGDPPVWQEYYVAKNGESVNGGFLLKPQPFALDGEEETVACYGLPISEGIVDPRHGMVGVQILRDAMQRNPLLFCLGMGSMEAPAAKLFAAMRWQLVACSFHFRVLRPARFLRGIAHLRRTRARRAALDAAAFSGLGWLGIKALGAWKGRRARGAANWTAATTPAFDERVDGVWTAARNNYSLIARRDLTVLRTLYPPDDARFIRLQVFREGVLLGWAVLLVTPMSEDHYFGNLRLGTVVDCLAVPGEEMAVVIASTRELRARRADLVVSNQLHRDWQGAFDGAGYLRGPSNFILAASPALAARMDPFAEQVARAHMTRGDGDGPIHL